MLRGFVHCVDGNAIISCISNYFNYPVLCNDCDGVGRDLSCALTYNSPLFRGGHTKSPQFAHILTKVSAIISRGRGKSSKALETSLGD